jgi:hypothetical protein
VAVIVPLEEYLYFDVIVHDYWWMPDGLLCGWATYNRPAPAANDP